MPLRNGGFVFYVDVWAFFNGPAVGLFELRNISQLVRGRTMCASTRVVILRQHRTIPALRLKHRFGGCGTASALPKCSIMSGCGTRIVLRGQKPLALCDRCPCFGSLFPPLAALTFAASSIICALGLAAAAPRSPYRHLELCGVALIKIVSPSYLPTFSLRPDFALFFCPFAQEKDSHSMEKALLSFRQQGNFYNVLFSDLCRITGGSNAVRCSS